MICLYDVAYDVWLRFDTLPVFGSPCPMPVVSRFIVPLIVARVVRVCALTGMFVLCCYVVVCCVVMFVIVI